MFSSWPKFVVSQEDSFCICAALEDEEQSGQSHVGTCQSNLPQQASTPRRFRFHGGGLTAAGTQPIQLMSTQGREPHRSGSNGGGGSVRGASGASDWSASRQRRDAGRSPRRGLSVPLRAVDFLEAAIVKAGCGGCSGGLPRHGSLGRHGGGSHGRPPGERPGPSPGGRVPPDRAPACQHATRWSLHRRHVWRPRCRVCAAASGRQRLPGACNHGQLGRLGQWPARLGHRGWPPPPCPRRRWRACASGGCRRGRHGCGSWQPPCSHPCGPHHSRLARTNPFAPLVAADEEDGAATAVDAAEAAMLDAAAAGEEEAADEDYGLRAGEVDAPDPLLEPLPSASAAVDLEAADAADATGPPPAAGPAAGGAGVPEPAPSGLPQRPGLRSRSRSRAAAGGSGGGSGGGGAGGGSGGGGRGGGLGRS
jgi:hypothetical protein